MANAVYPSTLFYRLKNCEQHVSVDVWNSPMMMMIEHYFPLLIIKEVDVSSLINQTANNLPESFIAYSPFSHLRLTHEVLYKEQDLKSRICLFTLSCFNSPCFVPKCLCRPSTLIRTRKGWYSQDQPAKRCKEVLLLYFIAHCSPLKRRKIKVLATALIFKECSFRSALFPLFLQFVLLF